MITDKDCGPGKVLVNGVCVPATPEEKREARYPKPAGQSDIQYYRQYLQDLPAYDAPGQGPYTGMGTAGFHPNYGVPGRSQSSRVLSTPLQTDSSGLNLTGVPGYAGGKSSFPGIDGYAGGRSGYDAADVASGYRVRETPKRMDAPFSMGDPYAQGGKLYNVGRLMDNRVDPYGGIDPTLLYDLRSNAAGGAELPPGYTAGLGRSTPSEGYIPVADLLGGIPGGGAPGMGGIIGGGAPVTGGIPGKGGGGLFNLGNIFGGGAPVAGGIGGGAPVAGGTSKGAAGGAKKGGGGAKKGGRSSLGGAKKPGSGLGVGTGGGSAGGAS